MCWLLADLPAGNANNGNIRGNSKGREEWIEEFVGQKNKSTGSRGSGERRQLGLGDGITRREHHPLGRGRQQGFGLGFFSSPSSCARSIDGQQRKKIGDGGR
jgi:hypothetical protein